MKIIVNNLAVEYRNEGRGPVMLFLHGWKTDLHTFDAITALLTPLVRVVRMDLPGFGGSEMPKRPWGVGEYADFVSHFCNKLEIQPEILVGHSFGGRVIIKGVSNGALIPKKVVLIDSAGVSRRFSLRNTLFKILTMVGKLMLFVFPSSIKEWFRQKLYQQAGSDYVNTGAMKETFLQAVGEDLSQNALKIKAPTLLIWGKNDTVTPLSDGKRLNQLISGSRLEVIAGTGHFVHKEKPKEVARAILEFLLNKGGGESSSRRM